MNLAFDNSHTSLVFENGGFGNAKVKNLHLSIICDKNILRVQITMNVSDEDLKISVADTGTGMEPSEVQKVFERFTRLNVDRHFRW